MKIEKAKEISKLANKLQYYEECVGMLKNGYNDKWQIQNSHTGAKVDIDLEIHNLISNFCAQKLNDIKKEIDMLN